ncbi:MAG: phosphatidate cytidylyltransferase [Sedimentisphaerales bacterium]|nr:phosphatidate cytidylyltransferase [Sedimentisphaerales bacterium]
MIGVVAGIILLDGILFGSGADGSNVQSWRGILVAVILAVLAGVGCAELQHLGRAGNFNPSLWEMVVITTAVITEPYWSGWLKINSGYCLAAVLMMGIFLAGYLQVRSRGISGTIANQGFTAFGVIYLGLGCWFILAIRRFHPHPAGLWDELGYLVMFLTCAKSCDIGAYFTGRFLGRHKWVPAISPKKTWEGLIGGIILAMIVASLFGRLSGIMSVTAALVFGLLIAVAGQLGDLLESMLKRDAGCKDSAGLIPEFGGVLDLLDSVIAAAPVAYFFLVIVAGADVQG